MDDYDVNMDVRKKKGEKMMEFMTKIVRGGLKGEEKIEKR